MNSSARLGQLHPEAGFAGGGGAEDGGEVYFCLSFHGGVILEVLWGIIKFFKS
jgi:hypothetical protein